MRKRRGGKRRSYKRIICLAGSLLLIFLAGIGIWRLLREAGSTTVRDMPGAILSEKTMEIMVMGIDPREGDAGRSDTLMLVTLHKEQRKASVLSIPRDTRALIEGSGYDKINHAYAYGGHAYTQRAVEQLLRAPVDYYVMIDVRAFERIIDALGGVDLEVEKRMYYEDPWEDNGGLLIDLYPGMQHLDGERAMGYVRYRDEEGDIGRIRRQQKFVRALLTKAVSPETLPQIPKLLAELKSVIKTDMPLTEMAEMVKLLPDIRENGVEAQMLPGQPAWWKDTSYWIPDIESARVLLSAQMGIDMTDSMKKAAAKDAAAYDKTLPEGISDIDGTLVKRYGESSTEGKAPVSEAPARSEDSTEKRRALKPEDISVRVLNESGINGAGAATAELLKKKGFRISEVGNGEISSRETTVFSVPERAVDLFYGMPFDCLIMANDETTLAVLRIGKDYR